MRASTVKIAVRIVPAMLLLGLILGASNAAGEPAPEQQAAKAEGAYPAKANWPVAGQNLNNTRYQSAETRIGPGTAGLLKVKWALPIPGSITATPAVEGGAIYFPNAPGDDQTGYLYKVHAETGSILWQREISLYTKIDGDWARNTPAVTEKSLILGDQPPCSNQDALSDSCPSAWLFAVDKSLGSLLWKTAIDTTRTAVVTQSAVVYGGRAYSGVASNQESLSSVAGFECCDFRGKAVAVNADTGKPELEAYMTPPTSTGYSGVSVWGSTPVVDSARNHVYITTGDNYSVPGSVEECVKKCGARKCTKKELLACSDPENLFDSIVALNLETFEVEWVFHGFGYDAFNNACIEGDPTNCPTPHGPDYDFGQGVALITVGSGENKQQLVGAGEKSGFYYALDPETGKKVWARQVGPGGTLGGSEWGSATDGERVYVAISNSLLKPWTLKGKGSYAGQIVRRGFWSALNAATGEILWQTPEPYQAQPNNPLRGKGPQGAVTVAGGVLFAGSTTPNAAGETIDMWAFDAVTGESLWSFSSGGTTNSGPSIVDGVVYWGNSSSNGTATLFAFCIAGEPGCPE